MLVGASRDQDGRYSQLLGNGRLCNARTKCGPDLFDGSVAFMPLGNVFLLTGQPKHFLRIAYDHKDVRQNAELENAPKLLGPPRIVLRNGCAR